MQEQLLIHFRTQRFRLRQRRDRSRSSHRREASRWREAGEARADLSHVAGDLGHPGLVRVTVIRILDLPRARELQRVVRHGLAAYILALAELFAIRPHQALEAYPDARRL